MTAQEIFDTVALHLLAQGEPAVAADGHTCAYRGLGGAKGAVGVLVPDEAYTPEMEGTSIYRVKQALRPHPDEDFGSRAGNYHALLRVLQQTGLVEHIDLLEDLQDVHDGHDGCNDLRYKANPTRFREKIKRDLGTVAERRKLDASILGVVPT